MHEKLLRRGSYVLIIAAILFLLFSEMLTGSKGPTLEEQGYVGVIDVVMVYASTTESITKDQFVDVPIRGGWTVADVMNTISSEHNIGMQTKEYGESVGMFIESINGVGGAGEGKWWQFWINGNYSNTGVSHTPVNADDFIEFKYTDNKYDTEDKI